jgi:hypothetical protein
MANIQHLLDSQPEPKYILKEIGEIAAANDREVYVVGGVVRDLFLDRKLKEIDLNLLRLLLKKWALKK